MVALLALLVVGGVGLRLRAPAIAEARVRSELAARGLEDVELEVESVGWDRLVLRGVSLAPDLAIGEVVIRYTPLGLLTGALESIELRDGRWDLRLEQRGLREGGVARLLAAPASDGSGDPTPIRISQARVRLLDAGGAAVSPPITLNGDAGLGRGRARLDVRSALGRHTIALRPRDGFAEVSVRGEGDRLELVVALPSDPEGAVRWSGAARLAPRAGSIGGHEVSLGGARLRGHGALLGARVRSLALSARAPRLSLDGVALGAVEVHVEDAPEGVRYRASAPELGSVSGALSRTPAGWASEPIEARWELEGPAAALALRELATRAGAELGAGSVRARGRARLEPTRRRARLGDVRVEAAFETLTASELELGEVRAVLRASAVFEPGREILELHEGSRLQAGRAGLAGAGARAFEARPVLRLERAEGRTTVVGQGVALRAGAAWLEPDVRWVAVEGALGPRDGSFGELRGGGDAALSFALALRAARVTGEIEGTAARLRGPVELSVGPGGVSGRAPLWIAIDALRHPQSELALSRIRARLPLRVDGASARGLARLRAGELSFRGHALGPSTGTLRVRPGGRTLALDCEVAPGSLAQLRVSESGGRGSVRVEVPVARFARGAPLSLALAELIGYRVSGTAGGELELDLEAPERGSARMVLAGAVVDAVDGSLRASGARGEVALAELGPAVSASPSGVTWTALALGGHEVLDAGGARLRFERSGSVRIDRFEAGFAGGEIALHPFAVDPSRPDVRVRARVRGLDVARALRGLTEGRTAGAGRLDGALELRVERASRRLELVDARLASRGTGWFQLGEAEALPGLAEWSEALGGDMILRRLAGALTDFAYERLTFTYPARGASRRLVAHIVGRGRTVPQDVDLTLRVRGAQALLDAILQPPETDPT